MQDDRLQDRHVIVTGAAQGIGRGIAERVGEAGAYVTIFDVNTESAAETEERVEKRGGSAQVIEVDVILLRRLITSQ